MNVSPKNAVDKAYYTSKYLAFFFLEGGKIIFPLFPKWKYCVTSAKCKQPFAQPREKHTKKEEEDDKRRTQDDNGTKLVVEK